MPETSEIHFFANIINSNCKGKSFIRITHSQWDKHPRISVPWSEFTISAIPRGKELKLLFEPALPVPGVKPVSWVFTHGLVGKWDWTTSSTLAAAPSGTHIMFHTATHSLIFMDNMKMGAWKETDSWTKSRSPDPMLEHFEFCNHFHSMFSKKKPTGTICEFLLDQQYFNGIGNYLRAEILYRAGVNPFTEVDQVFASTPKVKDVSSYQAIIADANGNISTTKLTHDPGLMILFLCRQVPLEVISAGMNKYGTADEQSKFKAWLRIYEKGSKQRQSGRDIHFSPQQRLGKQNPDLGKFIDVYPFPVVGYSNPTTSLYGSKPGISQSQSPVPSSAAGEPQAASSAFNHVKKIEENILPCKDIADLKVPISSKLLLSVTSLSRSGKLWFTEENALREVILMGHPVIFSAWVVYEASGDEDDFLDTARRVIAVTEEERNKIEAIDLGTTATNLVTTKPFPVDGPSNTSTTQNGGHKTTLINLTTPEKGKEKKQPRAVSISSSSSSKSNSDDDEDLMPPSKKKFGSTEKKSTKKATKWDFESNTKPTPTSSNMFAGFGKPSNATKSSASGEKVIDYLKEKSWRDALITVLQSTAIVNCFSFVDNAYNSNPNLIYPAKSDVWAAFNLCPLESIKVVILGQDPYHGPGQAHGLCFSVQKPQPAPPSLVNIFKELSTDIMGFKIPSHGDLTSWAKQGVFLLNTILTVYHKTPNSHANQGWENLTDQVIQTISNQRTNVVFMLWGASSQRKEKLIDGTKHRVLSCPHPSPLSAFQGWFGCKHFSQANAYLSGNGIGEIDWNIPE